MSKLVVVLGGTGNQGGSVIDAFLKDPAWKIRTVNRNPSKLECEALKAKGVEVVKGSFDDLESLKAAFKGATAIFAVTDFWAPMFDPSVKAKLEPGQLINEYAYNLELSHGKIIAQAAATALPTLTHFIWSTLANVRKLSRGKYTWVWHFDSKAAVDEYIAAKLPQLWEKTSTVQIGYYADNWKKMVRMGPQRISAPGAPVEVEWLGPSRPETQFPWVETRADTGKFVRALVKAAPGLKLLGVSRFVTYEEYMQVWGRVLGVKASYRQVSHEEYDKLSPPEIAQEIRESNLWNEEFGWDGGEEDVLRPWDLELEEPLATLEEYIKKQDWSKVLEE